LTAVTQTGYTFSGGRQVILPYLFGASGGYTSVVRAVNTTTGTPASVFLTTTSSTGTTVPYQATALTTVAANTTGSWTLEQLGAFTTPATTFLAAGTFGSGTLLVAGTSAVGVQSFLVQPGGSVLNATAGFAAGTPTATSNAFTN